MEVDSQAPEENEHNTATLFAFLFVPLLLRTNSACDQEGSPNTTERKRKKSFLPSSFLSLSLSGLLLPSPLSPLSPFPMRLSTVLRKQCSQSGSGSGGKGRKKFRLEAFLHTCWLIRMNRAILKKAPRLTLRI